MSIISLVVSLIFMSMGVTTTHAVMDPKPHLVFVFVDDWGYADVGFRNPAIKTPHFDMLKSTGLLLDRHYVFKYCSPSRASLLTGRWPHHVHQWNVDPPTSKLGLNLNITLLPAKLKQAGYHTHMVGKWHEGFASTKFLPINRGFDSSSGFLNGGEDHMNQVIGCAVDFWKDNNPDDRNGTYDANVYSEDLTSVIKNHDANSPLFLYLPLHNVHSPFQAPQEWLDIYPENSTCKQRRIYQAMVSVADNTTGHVVELLKSANMWDNTIMVVSADNGGAPCGGSNYPLKGCKTTFFEGGVRSLAFVNGGLLPDKVRGTTSKAFMHVADWYTTFCNLAGVDPSDPGPGKFSVDGVDIWSIITGENNTNPHEEIVLGYDYDNTGAVIIGDYKLIVGKQETRCDSLMWSPLVYPCEQGPKGENCDPYCLYNIVEDPGERNELSKKEPEKLKELLTHYNAYAKEPREMQDQGYHSNAELPHDNDACGYMHLNGDYWRPWITD